MVSKKNKQIGLKINSDMYEDLDKIAQDNDITIPELIRKSMKRVIDVS